MAITKLQIYNNALVQHLGQRRLADLNENRAPRRVLDEIWDTDLIRTCLEQGDWQFARRSVEMIADPNITTSFGFQFGFEQPDDYVLTSAVSMDEFFNEPMTDFADESGYFYASVDRFYVKYVSDDDQFGRDMSLWPQSFIEYIQCALARRAAKRITGSQSLVDSLQAEEEAFLSRAVGRDGINRPTVFLSRGGWNAARHGRDGSRDRRRRP